MAQASKYSDFTQQCLQRIVDDFVHRIRPVSTAIKAAPPLIVALLPRKASAANTVPFVPIQTVTPEQATSINQEGGSLDFSNWVQRGVTIRGGHDVYSCLANLTAALELVGQLSAAEYNGAAGALSLLPTAGALLGAPTREMWIVYKLVPVAGILSMCLSLGGSITPSNVGDYDPDEPFSYGGFMPTNAVKGSGRMSRPGSIMEDDSDLEGHNMSERERFIEEVRRRADEDGGGDIFLGVWIAMGVQLILIVAMLGPMYYAQRGAVVVWWCRVWGWMWFWYFLVTVLAIFDNLVAAPFTKSWTIRVSKTPTGLVLDSNAIKITDTSRYRNALEFIKAGPNMNQTPRIATDTGASYPRTCFYVVICVHGISTLHAIAQILAKCSSVAVFAFGTALFASAQLMSISITLMVLVALLPAGVAGRVIAMWIVSAMSRHTKPILHKMVRTEEEAARYIHSIAELDVQMEIKGHVIVNGTVVKSRHTWFAPETYIGLLASPYNVVAQAEKYVRASSGVHGTTMTSLPLLSPASPEFEKGRGRDSYTTSPRPVERSNDSYGDDAITSAAQYTYTGR